MMTSNTTKKITNTIIIIMITIAMIGLVYIASYYDTHYNRQATVTKIEGYEITVIDDCGFVWKFEGNDFTIDERVTLKMFNNCTDNIIKDDEIIDVKVLTE